MAWNPSPKVAAARDIGKKFKKKMVVVLMMTGDTLEYASYGETPKLCGDARKIADVAYDAVSDFVGACYAKRQQFPNPNVKPPKYDEFNESYDPKAGLR